jgi:itaconyl-CoA hydratase
MVIKAGWEGRFFEDFEVGDVYRSRIGRTITQADNIWFTLLTNNTNQIHFNEHYAERTEFGRPLVNSVLTLAIVAGLGVADTSENGFALGWDEIKLPNPLFDGDTLYSESEVVDKRESRSKPEWGIVKFRWNGGHGIHPQRNGLEAGARPNSRHLPCAEGRELRIHGWWLIR